MTVPFAHDDFRCLECRGVQSSAYRAPSRLSGWHRAIRFGDKNVTAWMWNDDEGWVPFTSRYSVVEVCPEEHWAIVLGGVNFATGEYVEGPSRCGACVNNLAELLVGGDFLLHDPDNLPRPVRPLYVPERWIIYARQHTFLDPNTFNHRYND